MSNLGIDAKILTAAQLTVRNHARQGNNSDWPHYSRRIYDVDSKWIDEFGSEIQMVHESDILQTS